VRVLNKIDYTVSPERYMGDEGALRLYYELDLLSIINISSRTLEESNRLEKILDVLNARKLYIPDREQLLAKVLHCPHCNERLSESEILLRKCGNCHGLLKLEDSNVVTKPIPSPRSGESEDDFISRCIATLSEVDSDRPRDQVAAICYRQWREKK
jgi:hypothetical protein